MPKTKVVAVATSVAVLLGLAACHGIKRGTPPDPGWLATTCTPSDSLRGRALLIGINDYKYDGPSLHDLGGAVRDVRNIRSTLERRFCFASEDIVELTDGAATRAGILAALDKLIDVADDKSAMVFYYSGHGSQREDPGPDGEADGFDETLVPSDSGRDGDAPNNDIVDDELHARFMRLAAKAPNVTVILDSCNSGTATRGLVSRTVRRDTRPTQQLARGDEGDTIGDSKRQEELPYTVISAARADESAYEKDIDGDSNGLLTWNLSRALRAAAPEHTLRDVMDQVKADVTTALSYQHPQLEGKGRDLEIFGSRQRAPQPYVDLLKHDKSLVLAAGRVHGVTVGSKFAVYPADDKAFAVGSQLLTVEVKYVREFNADVAVVEGTKPSFERARAIEREHRYDGTPVRVAFRNDGARATAALDPWVATLRKQLLGGALALEEVASEPAADLVLEVSPEAVRVLSPDGAPRSDTFARADANVTAMLQRNLMGWSRWLSLYALQNPQTQAAPIRLSNTRAASSEDGADVRVAAAEKHVTTVTNGTTSGWYVTPVVMGGDGSIDPQPASQGDEVAAAKAWSREYTACLADWQKDGTRDVLKVLLTDRQVDFGFLKQDPLTTRGGGPRSTGTPFGDLLATANRTRGQLRTDVPTWSWAARQQTIAVVPAPGAAACPKE